MSSVLRFNVPTTLAKQEAFPNPMLGPEYSADLPGLEDLTAQFSKMNFELSEWQATAKLAQSKERSERYEGTLRFRLMLSVSGEIPIQAVIDTGIVPVLVSYLSSADSDLQFESAWALTNIASGTKEQTEVIVRNGAIVKFINLLYSEREDIREHGMWGIGNFAGDRAEFRDVILRTEGAVHQLITAIRLSSGESTGRTGIWALCNLCRGQPRPEITLVISCADLLLEVIQNTNGDKDILADACWALSGLAEQKLGMTVIATAAAVQRVSALLTSPFTTVQRPALKIIGQVSSVGITEVQLVIGSGAIPSISRLLRSYHRSIRKDACWTLSSLLLGNENQQKFVLQQNVLPILLDVFSKDEEIIVRKEAAWAICIACITAPAAQVSQFANNQCVKSVCTMLEMNDSKVLMGALDALQRILKLGESQGRLIGSVTYNPYVQAITNEKGLSRITQLLDFPDFDISCKVNTIVASYLANAQQPHTWCHN